jgi:serine protease Do
MHPSRFSSRLAAAALIATVALSVAPSGAQTGSPASTAGTAPASVPPELARFNQLLADLADRLKPALVHIRVRRANAPKEEEQESPGDPRRSSGSGFVIDASGLIATNAHVIEGANWIQVRLFDGRRFTATVLGRDTRVDVAVIRIDGAGPLPVLTFGDANRLRVGEFVMALGHPFGLEHSVSFGIVSRKGAPLTVASPGFDFIQTDAAINPGNSGGPLVNMAGEVVGMNSMAARNGSIGFAIPSNLVSVLVPQLASKGKVEWGWLGVSITEVSDDDVDRLKLAEAKGVLVRGVIPGEPAERGGIKANDVLTMLDGTPLDGPRDLQRLVSSSPVGKKVRVGLVRAGQKQELEVEIGLYREQ